ncbi:MAG: CocE/NonD family hydrolase C-terminal non-catalytic domain-containing protein [Deinococcales bacterium]
MARHPTRTPYWQHGSICEDYSAIEAATLAVGGWCDAYSNTVFRLIENLKSPVKGLVGPWAHKYPHFAIPKPQIGFLQECLRWWDQWLKGIDRGVMADPLIKLYQLDSYPPKAHHDELAGEWLAFETWPPQGVKLERLTLSQLNQPNQPNEVKLPSPENLGTQSGEFCVIWLGPEWPLDQRHDDSLSYILDFPLEESLSIIGAPVVKLKLKSQSPVANLSVRLNDVRPDGEVTRISYGILNLNHRHSHEHPADLPLNEAFEVSIALDEIAYQLPKGHQLRLSLSTSYFPLIWPSKEKACLYLDLKASYLELPLLKQKPDYVVEFSPPASAPEADITPLRTSRHERKVSHDIVNNTTHTHIIDDFGIRYIKRYDLEAEEYCEEHYSIQADDPLSAKASNFWRQGLKRGDWHILTESYSELSCDREFFYLEAYVKAFEEDRLVFEKHWQEKVKRL